MADTYKLWVPGKPVPKERPRMTRRGNAYTPQRTHNYENSIKAAWLGAWGDTTIEGPVAVHVDFTAEGAAITIEPIEHTGTKHRGDIDNLIKSCLDGLQGAAFPNDSAVQEVWAVKL